MLVDSPFFRGFIHDIHGKLEQVPETGRIQETRGLKNGSWHLTRKVVAMNAQSCKVLKFGQGFSRQRTCQWLDGADPSGNENQPTSTNKIRLPVPP